jgi:hypothetical protein
MIVDANIFSMILSAVVNDGPQPEILNKRALTIVSRVRDKLTGRDFPNETEGTLSIDRQVELLIRVYDVQARSFRPASFRPTFIGPERRKNWA